MKRTKTSDFEVDVDKFVVILQGRSLGMFLISRRDDGEDPKGLISG